MGTKHSDWFPGLYEQSLVVAQFLKGFGDQVEILPGTGGLADASIYHEFVGILSNLRVEVVHYHPVRSFGEPRAAVQFSSSRGLYRPGCVLCVRNDFFQFDSLKSVENRIIQKKIKFCLKHNFIHQINQDFHFLRRSLKPLTVNNP